MTFESMVSKLHQFWMAQGCTITLPYDMEKGAATLSPHTFFKALDPKPCSIAYVEPCRRPIDSRYAEDKTDRYQWYYQYQVLIKPATNKPKSLFLDSLATLGITEEHHKIQFIDDNWVSPVFGANAEGWEVWVDGSEIAQVSYLNQVGGIKCKPAPLEIAYGLERLASKIQRVESFHQIKWNNNISYGDLYKQQEVEQSTYNCETSSPEILKKLLALYFEEAEQQLKKELVYPSLDYVLKSSHIYNLLEARNVLSKEQLEYYVCEIRMLANKVGELYLQKWKYNKQEREI